MVQQRVRMVSVRTLTIWLVAAFTLVFVSLVSTAAAEGVIPTDRGPVRGVSTPTEKEYLGIPFAAPPVGNLRWRPPRTHARWTTPLDATHFANHCPQSGSFVGGSSLDEDCLYLNVYTPNLGNGKGHAKGLPVMFWIHGGALEAGQSDDYDPTRLVQKGRVVVTINYRLGWLGFLAHPALSAESPYHGSGDYGFMDQQAALRWVKHNIANFGGDPGNVTIFGQSAGGQSVHVQLASPLAAGLFEGAIAQSGAYADGLQSLAAAEQNGSDIANRVGCQDQTAACLRSVPVQDLLPTQPSGGLPIVPNVDGYVLTQSPRAAFESGDFNRVPIVEGSTHDEFRSYAATLVPNVDKSLYPLVVGIFVSTLHVPASASDIVKQYPISNYGPQFTVPLALAAIATDYLWSCPGRRDAKAFSKFVPTHTYEFNDPNAPNLLAPPVAGFPFGAYHASELPYLFDSATRGGHAPLTPDQEQLASAMVDYWTQFAANGDPNSPATPEWPAYTAAGDTYQSLHPPTPAPESGYAADHKCAFWDSYQ
jgi:para-nitrobenzyl esterase